VSGFLVPTPVGGTATGWAVVDWLDNSYSSQPAAAGVAQWTGCSAGAVGTLTVQGQIMRQVAA
jgi:hypothetical protein